MRRTTTLNNNDNSNNSKEGGKIKIPKTKEKRRIREEGSRRSSGSIITCLGKDRR